MMSRPCHTCVTIPGVTGSFGFPKVASIATTGTPLLFACASTGSGRLRVERVEDDRLRALRQQLLMRVTAMT